MLQAAKTPPRFPNSLLGSIQPTPASRTSRRACVIKSKIVRFKAQDDDSLVLVDGKDQPILENGKPIRLENSASIARERLSWVSIAQDGKDDYTEEVVIQPGAVTGYKHKLQLPTRAQLPLPLPVPMRYRLTVEVGNQSASDAVDFAILKAGQRPKRFGAGGK